MTLSTHIYVLDACDVAELFRFCQSLLTRYDDDGGHRLPERQLSSNEPGAWRSEGAWSMSNKIGQGLPAILDITYRPGGPLTTQEQSEACGSDCEPDDDYHYHPRACWADIDFDTAYSARFEGGMGCGDLHAALVAEVGKWCDERNLRWEWRNEFTGDVHSGEDRYARLIDLCSGGFEATAWFTHTVKPAIEAKVAAEGGTAEWS